jgi:hypothetical protein
MHPAVALFPGALAFAPATQTKVDGYGAFA